MRLLAIAFTALLLLYSGDAWAQACMAPCVGGGGESELISLGSRRVIETSERSAYNNAVAEIDNAFGSGPVVRTTNSVLFQADLVFKTGTASGLSQLKLDNTKGQLQLWSNGASRALAVSEFSADCTTQAGGKEDYICYDTVDNTMYVCESANCDGSGWSGPYGSATSVWVGLATTDLDMDGYDVFDVQEIRMQPTQDPLLGLMDSDFVDPTQPSASFGVQRSTGTTAGNDEEANVFINAMKGGVDTSMWQSVYRSADTSHVVSWPGADHMVTTRTLPYSWIGTAYTSTYCLSAAMPDGRAQPGDDTGNHMCQSSSSNGIRSSVTASHPLDYTSAIMIPEGGLICIWGFGSEMTGCDAEDYIRIEAEYWDDGEDPTGGGASTATGTFVDFYCPSSTGDDSSGEEEMIDAKQVKSAAAKLSVASGNANRIMLTATTQVDTGTALGGNPSVVCRLAVNEEL